MRLISKRKFLASFISILLSLVLSYHFMLSRPKVSSSDLERTEKLKRNTPNLRKFIIFSDDAYPHSGLRHLRTNFKCQISIAQFLNKTMVFPKFIGIPALHSTSLLYPTQRRFQAVLTESIINVKSLSLYFDVVSSDDVTLNKHNSITYQFRRLPIVRKNKHCCWQELCSYDPPPSSTKYSIKNVENNFHSHQYPQYLLDLTHKLISTIQTTSYTAIHIRRGDRLNETRFANRLDNCTRPAWIREKLNSYGISNGAIYVATDEYQPNFFDPLTQWYTLYTIRNFSNSINETIKQNPYALVLIDEIIYSKAKVKFSTFIEPYTKLSFCPFGRAGIGYPKRNFTN